MPINQIFSREVPFKGYESADVREAVVSGGRPQARDMQANYTYASSDKQTCTAFRLLFLPNEAEVRHSSTVLKYNSTRSSNWFALLKPFLRFHEETAPGKSGD